MKNLAIFFSCAVLLLFAYVTSYSLNVQRGRGGFLVRLAGHYEEGQKLPVSASYRIGGRWAERLYLPIQLLDRHVRQDYWTLTFHRF